MSDLYGNIVHLYLYLNLHTDCKHRMRLLDYLAT